jgi:hypothetical protein
MSYTPIYFTVDEITDNLASKFVHSQDNRLDKWYEYADKKVNTLALTLGVEVDDIVIPVFETIKEYAIYSLYIKMFTDVYGENDVDVPDEESYFRKKEGYKSDRDELLTGITANMFLLGANGALTQSSFVGTIYLNRI